MGGIRGPNRASLSPLDDLWDLDSRPTQIYQTVSLGSSVNRDNAEHLARAKGMFFCHPPALF
jgi:hypothetical protein